MLTDQDPDLHHVPNSESVLCAGFTAVDLLGHGTLGHIAGVGIILGLKVYSEILHALQCISWTMKACISL